MTKYQFCLNCANHHDSKKDCESCRDILASVKIQDKIIQKVRDELKRLYKLQEKKMLRIDEEYEFKLRCAITQIYADRYYTSNPNKDMEITVIFGKRKLKQDLQVFVQSQPQKIIRTGYTYNGQRICITPEDVMYTCPFIL